MRAWTINQSSYTHGNGAVLFNLTGMALWQPRSTHHECFRVAGPQDHPTAIHEYLCIQMRASALQSRSGSVPNSRSTQTAGPRLQSSNSRHHCCGVCCPAHNLLPNSSVSRRCFRMLRLALIYIIFYCFYIILSFYCTCSSPNGWFYFCSF